MAALKRIQKELGQIAKSAPSGITAGPINGDNMLAWEAAIKGDAGTPWEGGTFKLKVDFAPDYPFKPPKVQFETKMYHPNIDDSGAICLPMLKEWSPACTITKVMEQIKSLLLAPATDTPLKADIATQYTSDLAAYEAKVRETVAAYAK